MKSRLYQKSLSNYDSIKTSINEGEGIDKYEKTQESLSNYDSIKTSINEGEGIDKYEKTQEYFRDFIHSQILSKNSHNIFEDSEIIELFNIADLYKDEGMYGKANEIFSILLDYALNNPGAGIQPFIESNSYTGNFSDDMAYYSKAYKYYYDLAVLKFKDGEYLNIPLPLLSKKTATLFFNSGVSVMDRYEHNREEKCESSTSRREELEMRYAHINPKMKHELLLGTDEPYHDSITQEKYEELHVVGYNFNF